MNKSLSEAITPEYLGIIWVTPNSLHENPENFEQIDGYPKSTRLRKCGILRAKETPEMEVIGVEVNDPHGPYGAKGVGEIGLVPTAAAVANALCQVDGIRRYNLPMQVPKTKKVQKEQTVTENNE